MKIEEIEQLISIFRDAKVSELAVSSNGSKIRLRKQIPQSASVTKKAAPSPDTHVPVQQEQASQETSVDSSTYVSASMVGIFHSMQSVVSIGSHVTEGAVVGAIESMKLMNDVLSDHEGVIAEILVEDGMPVEYGQHLYRLEPLSGGEGDAS